MDKEVFTPASVTTRWVVTIKKPINGDVVYLFEDEDELEDYHIRRTYMKQNEVEESVIRDVEHYASVAKDTTGGGHAI